MRSRVWPLMRCVGRRRAPIARESPLLRKVPAVLLPTCSSFPKVSGGLRGETEVQAGRGIPQVA